MLSLPVEAQAIAPAADGTATAVTRTGERFDISGGQRSQDGANLFHSFQRFGLAPNQVANFLSNPALRNILGRVTGGEASFINGLIQVTGGTSNLYLMNPAGVVFGADARLNVPAAFTTTTATGIGFGDQWFNGLADNDYSTLVGVPDAFAFATAQPGAIINAGNLAVTSGQSLTLLGGTVINTGHLAAPEGQLTVASVAGTSLVRLSQTGSSLYLEFLPLPTSSTPSASPTTPSLAQLLTGGEAANATGLTVRNGAVELTGSGIRVEAGDVVVRRAIAQTAMLSAQRNLALVESQLQTTGDLYLLAQGTVQIRDSTTNPFLAKAGGALTVQGNQGIDILAFSHPAPALQSGGNLSLISNGFISGDAHYVSGGNVLIRNLAGGGVPFISFYDPIFTVEGDFIQPGTYTGAALKVQAGGNITFGGIQITTPDITATGDPDSALLTTSRALILRSGGNITTGQIDTSPAVGVEGGPVILSATGNITTGEINTSSVGFSGNTVALLAGSNITTGEINTVSDGGSPGNSGAVSLNAVNGSITVSTIRTFKGGMEAGAARQPGNGGAVTLNARQDIVIDGELNSGSGGIGSAGSINLSSDQGEVRVGGQLFARSDQGTGGAIALNTGGTLTLNSVSTIGVFGGGNISLNSAGAINIQGVITSGTRLPPVTTIQTPTGDGGNVSLAANGNITIGGLINTSVPPTYLSGSAGDIRLNSRAGAITTRDRLDAGVTRGRGGNISLTAQQDINTAGLVSYVVNNGTGNAGDLFLSSTAGAINVGVASQGVNGLPLAISTRSENGNAGNIRLEAETGIMIAPDTASAVIDLAAIGATGDGGNLTVKTNSGNLMIGAAISTASNNGNGGSVTLDPPALIQVNTINAQGGTNGVGGAIDITAGLFRATGTFTDRNGIAASLSAAGGQGGGSMIIRHNGGSNGTPFIVGNASVNGTAGAITTGTDNSILPFQSFPGIYRQGNPPNNIQVLTQEPSPPFYPPPSNLRSQAFVPMSNLDEQVFNIEKKFTEQFDRGIGQPGTPIKTLEEIQQELSTIQRQSGIKTAIIYGVFVTQARPQVSEPRSSVKADPYVKISQQLQNQLELVLVTADNKPLSQPVRVLQPEAIKVAESFSRAIKRGYEDHQDRTYLPLSQQLHQWLVAPLKAELDRQGIQNLVFILDEGLRSLPIAALHNGQSFLVEQFSVGLVPSMSLTNSRYSNISNAEVLAMGASQFPALDGLPREPSLPYASVEVNTIARELWQGIAFLNTDFTVMQLKAQRQQKQYGIVHLATHAAFDTENLKGSYIRFYNQRLDFSTLKTIDWNDPPIELLVLSACETAIGGPQAELGFAGLTVQTGVTSALASLWLVNDEATFVLMTKFYQSLSTSSIKAEGLRKAQIEMLRKQKPQRLSVLLENLEQQGIDIPELLRTIDERVFSHPYFWAGFTIVGNPW